MKLALKIAAVLAAYWAIITTVGGIGESELLLLGIPAVAAIVWLVRQDRKRRVASS